MGENVSLKGSDEDSLKLLQTAADEEGGGIWPPNVKIAFSCFESAGVAEGSQELLPFPLN